MIKLNEVNRMSIEDVVKTIKEIGTTQQFVEQCVGMTPGHLSYCKTNETPINPKYQERLINTLYGLRMLRAGQPIQPAQPGDLFDPSGDLYEALEILKRDCDQINNKIIRKHFLSILTTIQETLDGSES